MDSREEKIRVRAYEIWEREGCGGNPQDHWLEAERALQAEEQHQAVSSEDRPAATVEESSPVQAVEALEAAIEAPPKRRRSSSKG